MIWTHLGFIGNIYFPDPLPIDNNGMRLLCGRDYEIDLFISEVLSDNKCLKIITGEVGVGKTSFVNVCQQICYESKREIFRDYTNRNILPSYKKIEITNNDNIDSFSIKAIISICINIKTHFVTNGKKIPEKLNDYIEYWTHIKLQTNPGGFSLGVSVLGCGGQIGKNFPTYSFHEIKDPHSSFTNLLKLLIDHTNIEGVFMFIDNLDIVKDSELVRILDEIRDSYFLIEHVYWILVGQKGLSEIISSNSRRIGGYLTGSELFLDKLQPQMFLKAIDERQNAFKIKDQNKLEEFKNIRRNQARQKLLDQTDIEGHQDLKYLDKYSDFSIFPPIDESTHLMLYDFTHRELRESFKMCKDICLRAQEYIKTSGQLPLGLAMNTLIEYCDSMTSLMDLKIDHIDILGKIYLMDFVNNDKFADFGYRSSSGFESLLRKFAEKGLLLKKNKLRTKTYDISWKLEALAICGILGKECAEKSYLNHFSDMDI